MQEMYDHFGNDCTALSVDLVTHPVRVSDQDAALWKIFKRSKYLRRGPQMMETLGLGAAEGGGRGRKFEGLST